MLVLPSFPLAVQLAEPRDELGVVSRLVYGHVSESYRTSEPPKPYLLLTLELTARSQSLACDHLISCVWAY